MPELPEVQGLVDFLDEHLGGLAVEALELASFTVLKTVDPPPPARAGAPVAGVHRHGKFLDIDCDGTHLVIHLARAGWIRFSEELPRTMLRPGKSPVSLRLRMSDGSGFDLTEAGTKKSVAAYLVRDVHDVPGVARLGPDPLAPDFTREAFGELLAGEELLQLIGLQNLDRLLPLTGPKRRLRFANFSTPGLKHSPPQLLSMLLPRGSLARGCLGDSRQRVATLGDLVRRFRDFLHPIFRSKVLGHLIEDIVGAGSFQHDLALILFVGMD